MALPTISTSFAPHPTASSPHNRLNVDIAGALVALVYFILVGVFLIAIGIFFYDRYLTSQKNLEDAALIKAENALDPTTVSTFVRLRDRLNAGQKLLANHVAFSGFLTALEQLLPSDVSINSLNVTLDSSGVAQVIGSGVAKSFNALTVTSTSFATDGRIKNAIFSNIRINSDNSVSFALSATLDPKVVTFSP